MSEQPLVSVLIPVYNAGEYLKEAVLSIVNQTYTHLEIIIIDDGSTDGCIETVHDINDPRIKLIRQQNAGKAAALNHALDKMKGEYFIVQDADDRSYPQRVEVQLKQMMHNPQLAAAFIGHDLILGDKQFAPVFKEIDEKKCHELIAALKIPAHDALGMYRMALLGDIRFDPSLRIEEGVDFVLRVGEKFPLMCIGECLYSYRINYNSITRQQLEKTIASVNLVKQRACARRNLDFDQFKISKSTESVFFKHRLRDTHIIPHCMESVVQLKQTGKISEAFSVGWQCLILHPLDPYYYKPLLYVMTPLKLIESYRKLKK